MVSTSGAQLLEPNAVTVLRNCLLPLATVLTPNVPEAKVLLSNAGQEIEDPRCVQDLINIAKAIQALGSEYVLVKGGHLPLKNDETIASAEAERKLIMDILYGNGEVLRIASDYQPSKNTHGTGCSLACEYCS